MLARVVLPAQGNPVSQMVNAFFNLGPTLQAQSHAERHSRDTIVKTPSTGSEPSQLQRRK